MIPGTNDPVSNFLRGNPSGRLFWLLDFDLNWVENRPEEVGTRMALMEDFGSVIVHGIMQSHFALSTHDGSIQYKETPEGNIQTRTWRTPLGTARTILQDGHPIEHPIKTPEDCRVMRYVHEHTHIAPNPDAIQIPLHLMTLNPSPVQQLLQYDMGLENFYGLLMDHPGEVESLIAAMQQNQMKILEIACGFDSQWIYRGENTSTTMISPAYYERLSLPQIRQYADYVHGRDKKLMLHMCGLLKDLLTLFVKAGIDGIHSVTPPPVGNTPFEDVYRHFPSDFPIFGRFGSTQWHNLPENQIRQNLDNILTKDMLMKHPFILQVTLDSVHVEYSELKRLRQILETYEPSN
jgi:hypothetical protein